MGAPLDPLATAGNRLDSVRLLGATPSYHNLRRWSVGMLVTVLLVLLLPWQQNVQALGEVTALDPMERPQQAVATVGGRIVEWYVAEGQRVRAGDPLVALAEVKESYLDPQALARTGVQLDQKRQAVLDKRAKAEALARQRVAVEKNKKDKKTNAATCFMWILNCLMVQFNDFYP